MPQPKYLSLDEFRAQVAAKGERPTGAVRKAFGGCEVKAVEGESRTLSIRITTGARDRDRDTIDPAGWDLGNFLKNPVVLYGHDYYGLPIAQDTGITHDAKGLLARPKFAEPDDYAFADTVYKLMLKGFLRAASVGMNPKVFQFNEEERGLDFKEQELLEYSIVCVPANPEALLEAKATGIDLAPLKAYAEQLLDTMHGERGLWMPRKSIERAYQIVAGDVLVIPVPATATAEQRAKAATASFETLLKDGAAAGAGEVDPPPAPGGEPAPAPEGLAFEFDEVPAPTVGELQLDCTLEDLGVAVSAAATRAVSAQFTALTGRLD